MYLAQILYIWLAANASFFVSCVSAFKSCYVYTVNAAFGLGYIDKLEVLMKVLRRPSEGCL